MTYHKHSFRTPEITEKEARSLHASGSPYEVVDSEKSLVLKVWADALNASFLYSLKLWSPKIAYTYQKRESEKYSLQLAQVFSRKTNRGAAVKTRSISKVNSTEWMIREFEIGGCDDRTIVNIDAELEFFAPEFGQYDDYILEHHSEVWPYLESFFDDKDVEKRS